MQPLLEATMDRLNNTLAQFADWAIIRLSPFASQQSTTPKSFYPTPTRDYYTPTPGITPTTYTSAPPTTNSAPSQAYAILLVILVTISFTTLTTLRIYKYTLASRATQASLRPTPPTDLSFSHLSEAGEHSHSVPYQFFYGIYAMLSSAFYVYSYLRDILYCRIVHNQELEDRCREALLQRDEMARQLTTSYQLNASQAKTIDERDARIVGLNDTVAVTESENTRLKIQLDNANVRLQERDTEITSKELDDLLTDAYARQEQTTARSKRQGANVEQLERLLEISESTRDGNAKLLIGLTAQVVELEQKCETEGRSIRSLSSQIAGLAGTRKNLQVKVDTLQIELSHATNTLSQTTQEVNNLNTTLRKEKKKLAAEIVHREMVEDMLAKTKAKGLQNALQVSEDSKKEAKALRRTARDQQLQVQECMIKIKEMETQILELEDALETEKQQRATSTDQCPTPPSNSSPSMSSHHTPPYSPEGTLPYNPFLPSFTACRSKGESPISSTNTDLPNSTSSISSHYTPPYSPESTTPPYPPHDLFEPSNMARLPGPYFISAPRTPRPSSKPGGSRFHTTPTPLPGRKEFDYEMTGTEPTTNSSPLSESDSSPTARARLRQSRLHGSFTPKDTLTARWCSPTLPAALSNSEPLSPHAGNVRNQDSSIAPHQEDYMPSVQNKEVGPSHSSGLTRSDDYFTATDSSLAYPMDAEADVIPPHVRLFRQGKNDNDVQYPNASAAGMDVFTTSIVRLNRAATYDALRRSLEEFTPRTYTSSAALGTTSQGPITDMDAKDELVSTMPEPVTTHMTQEKHVSPNEIRSNSCDIEYVTDEERSESFECFPSPFRNVGEDFSVGTIGSGMSNLAQPFRDFAEVFENAQTPPSDSAVSPHVGFPDVRTASPLRSPHALKAISVGWLHELDGGSNDVSHVQHNEDEESSPQQPQTPLDAGPSPTVHIYTNQARVRRVGTSPPSWFQPTCASPDFAPQSWGLALWDAPVASSNDSTD
ncbi:hypothetical protein FRB95_008128 [Tulasnella sp. JGI-2019a]|nr:hypothetical protein FRB95_008128 [Tulasnella sp. JGI-2019a]